LQFRRNVLSSSSWWKQPHEHAPSSLSSDIWRELLAVRPCQMPVTIRVHLARRRRAVASNTSLPAVYLSASCHVPRLTTDTVSTAYPAEGTTPFRGLPIHCRHMKAHVIHSSRSGDYCWILKLETITFSETSASLSLSLCTTRRCNAQERSLHSSGCPKRDSNRAQI
jgi:hypothetical protein